MQKWRVVIKTEQRSWIGCNRGVQKQDCRTELGGKVSRWPSHSTALCYNLKIHCVQGSYNTCWWVEKVRRTEIPGEPRSESEMKRIKYRWSKLTKGSRHAELWVLMIMLEKWQVIRRIIWKLIAASEMRNTGTWVILHRGSTVIPFWNQQTWGIFLCLSQFL